MNTDPAAQGINSEHGTESQHKAGRTFTQEQVNEIVQGRLGKLRAQAEAEAKAAYEQKTKELRAKELQLLAREKLADSKLPLELASVITCTDEDDLDSKIAIIQKTYNSGTGEAGSAAQEKGSAGIRVGVGAPGVYSGDNAGGPIRAAFGLNRK